MREAGGLTPWPQPSPARGEGPGGSFDRLRMSGEKFGRGFFDGRGCLGRPPAEWMDGTKLGADGDRSTKEEEAPSLFDRLRMSGETFGRGSFDGRSCLGRPLAEGLSGTNSSGVDDD